MLELLKTKNSPAVPDVHVIYTSLVASGVDPSFALAQFRVESQYGTSGYARVTGSWGNMLFDSSLCLHASGKYSPGNGYTYATYDNYADAIADYCHYIHDYAERRGLTTIYEATAEWIGKVPGSSGHLSYVTTVVNDMVAYENPPGSFYEVGDKMIYAGKAIDKSVGRLKQKYPVTSGLPLYRGTNGDLLKKYSGDPGLAWFLGPVQGSWDWGAIIIGTSSADVNGTIVYIKQPDPAKVKTV